MNITLEQLSVGYKGFPPVVSNINVEIKSGELTCLIGSNGIGKSTLLKTLTGFLPKLSGRLLLDGRDINMLSQRERAKYISIVLTYKSDVQNLSVTEMVGMGRMPYTGFWGKLNTSDQTIVAEAIEMVGIEHLKNRMIQTLSDGERQKVMIAKALAQQTPVILLDEPTSFLDFPSKVEMLQLLHRLAKETNKVVFLSTHDLELALRIADRLVELNKNGLQVVPAQQVKEEINRLLE
ncbi:ABC transporter ATP-binding protein [Prevotella pallens]|jgi:putative ferrichrome transport ATP-binding protein fhuC|uniref:ABC transporter ATP-binding protein n=1 Tax=Prevotella pallens TaxID=60133 RepID=UPI001CADFB89|nr:ABC transporter ATP-binding protein [Prevotella pallens]MBF1443490.1 ABC transporter ATP-binding protein [Prevotella pallens]MBF1475940.1 ABC transporter ATP-binding protein [Prevotella pallens]MBF1480165.1 ABC transporter ATP-binding protein [Prevotella pallens]MBF1482132.1 ABC transporter ATP-binding protein [Prevotella pallens]MBF1484814.1 ABC transporter ATP-binding protein [Prevotella pallens]